MRRLLAALASLAVSVGSLARGQPRGSELGYLVDYRGGMEQWLTPEELARFALPAEKEVRRGGLDRMVMTAADRAVRTLLPLALDAGGQSAQAAQLRALPPIADRRTLEAARAALAHLHDREPEPDGPLPIDRFPVTTTNGIVEEARQVRNGRPPPHGAYLPALAHAALHAGADRRQVVADCLSLYESLRQIAAPAITRSAR